MRYATKNSFSRNQCHADVSKHVSVRACSYNTWARAIFITRQRDLLFSKQLIVQDILEQWNNRKEFDLY